MGVHHSDQVLYQQLSFSYTFSSADIRKFVFQMKHGFPQDLVYSLVVFLDESPSMMSVELTLCDAWY